MIRTLVTAATLALMVPLAASAQYDPAVDRSTARVLGERIDGDVAGGLVPGDRAALLRAEISAAQGAIANGDSQATAMLADIDRDLAPYDKTLDANEADIDLLYHTGDRLTIALRDGKNWQIESLSNRDVLDRAQTGVMYVIGVQGIFLAKSAGYAAIVLNDPASGRRLRFRFTIVDRAPSR